MKLSIPRSTFIPLLGFFIPALASAHEVYVLPPDVVAQAIATPPFSEWQTLITNIDQFVLWGFIAIFVVFIIFFASLSRIAEKTFDPFLAKLPPYAPVISRITIGLSFLAAAYSRALFGPELPLVDTFGASLTPVIVGILSLIGVMIITGLYVRVAALVAVVLFLAEIAVHGTYMLTYANYMGEMIMLVILGSHMLGFHDKKTDVKRAPKWLLHAKESVAPFSFFILRVAFGTSLLFASLYAKIFHDNLAFAVTNQYPGIVAFFGFEPHFLVLGAAIVEVVIALFFILGIEIRFVSLFLLFWLSLSLWYFGEAVWPHIILIGIPIAFICYGYDKYSLEGYFFKKGKREPVL